MESRWVREALDFESLKGLHQNSSYFYGIERFAERLRAQLQEGGVLKGMQIRAAQELLKSYDAIKAQIPWCPPDDVPGRWMIRDLQTLLQNMAALSALALGFTQQQVMADLPGESPEIIQGVLTRWRWMRFQARSRDISEFPHPFLCRVGAPSRRNTRDLEFYKLLCFLPQYATDVGKRFHFSEHLNSGPPDFKVEREGEILGIEVTEVPVRHGYHLEQVYREKFTNSFLDRFQTWPFTLLITANPGWQILSASAEEIFQTFGQFMESLSSTDTDDEWFFFRSESLGLKARIKRNGDRFCLLSNEDDDPAYETENEFLEAAQRSLDDKMKLRNFHHLPAKLVMYLNGAFHIRKDYISRFQEYLTIRDDGVYSEIWLLDEKWILRLR